MKISKRLVERFVGSRIGELTLGHAVNAALVYGFDYALYPYVIWKLGLVRGGAVMSVLSLVSCLLTLWFYDWSKRDWLGIETVKQLRDSEAKTRCRRALAWTLAKGDLPACVALSIYADPFITTACLRRGAFNGMTRRDWRIFFVSWFIANGWWTLACFGGVEAVSHLWRWLAP
jgi:predicted membrane-bound spermidine synthase